MNPLKTADILLQEESDKHDVLLFIETSRWHRSLTFKEILNLSVRQKGEKQNIKNSKDLKVILTYVNTRLNDPILRLDGLLLLSSVVAQASPQVFAENYQHWIQHVKKIAIHDADERIRCLAVRILGEILQIASKYPEHQRQLAASVASQIIVQILDMDENYDLTVAYSLANMLKFFPGPCRQYSTGIQKRILEMLSVKNNEIVEVASTCMSLLPFISGGDRGKSQASAWFELFTKFCRTLHWELNTLYENLEVDEQITVELSEQILFPLTLESADAAAMFLSSYRRAISIFLCLQKLLKNEDAVLLKVPVEEVFTLIYRVLKINGKSLALHEAQDCQRVLLHAVLPIIHSEALALLEHVLLSCRTHMLLHDKKILTLIHQTLQWTSATQPDNETKPILSTLRGTASRVLITWLRVAGSATDFTHFGDSIVRQLLKDTFLEEKHLAEAGKDSYGANFSKTKRPKLAEAILTPHQKHAHLLMENDTCRLALNALNIILYTASEDLRISTLKEIETKLLYLLLKLQQGFNGQLALSLYYGDVGCRAALYELLLAIVVTPSLTTQVLLAKSMHIFSRGQIMDACPEIWQVCYRGLAICRTVIEPVRRCLPISVMSTANDSIPHPSEDAETSMEISGHERLEQPQQQAVSKMMDVDPASILTSGVRSSPDSNVAHTRNVVVNAIFDDDDGSSSSIRVESDDEQNSKCVTTRQNGLDRNVPRDAELPQIVEIILEDSSPPKKILKSSPKDLEKTSFQKDVLKTSPEILEKSSPLKVLEKTLPKTVSAKSSPGKVLEKFSPRKAVERLSSPKKVALDPEHSSLEGQTSKGPILVDVNEKDNDEPEAGTDKLQNCNMDEQAPEKISDEVNSEPHSTQAMLSSFVNSQPDDNDASYEIAPN